MEALGVHVTGLGVRRDWGACPRPAGERGPPPGRGSGVLPLASLRAEEVAKHLLEGRAASGLWAAPRHAPTSASCLPRLSPQTRILPLPHVPATWVGDAASATPRWSAPRSFVEVAGEAGVGGEAVYLPPLPGFGPVDSHFLHPEYKDQATRGSLPHPRSMGFSPRC